MAGLLARCPGRARRTHFICPLHTCAITPRLST